MFAGRHYCLMTKLLQRKVLEFHCRRWDVAARSVHRRQVTTRAVRGTETPERLDNQVSGEKTLKDVRVVNSGDRSCLPPASTNLSKLMSTSIGDEERERTGPVGRNSRENPRERAGRQRLRLHSAGIKAAENILDPEKKLVWEPVTKWLGADVIVHYRAHDTYRRVRIKVKSATERDGRLKFSVARTDGNSGARWEHIISVAVALHVPNRIDVRLDTEFDYVPDLEASQIFVYPNAAQCPRNTLEPYGRTKKNDIYNDNRYVFGFDEESRLDRLRQIFFEAVDEKLKSTEFTRHDFFFSYGPGTPNPNVHSNQAEKLMNAEILSTIFGGTASIVFPKRQYGAVDAILLGKWRLLLKTASRDKMRQAEAFFSKFNRTDFENHCDAVVLFFRDENGLRTHLSVVKARDICRPGKIKCYWSPTTNAHVLEKRIRIDHSNYSGVRDEIIRRLNECISSS
eukprot:GHVU01161319.1.p1 GENE.GHVU01161319.1~~GHVU01161319.1.p1  ORF type:complete len:455 (+),score=29.69 GHVU01161319.1:48-1412(+)